MYHRQADIVAYLFGILVICLILTVTGTIISLKRYFGKLFTKEFYQLSSFLAAFVIGFGFHIVWNMFFNQ